MNSQTTDPPIVVQPARRVSSDMMMQSGMPMQPVPEQHDDERMSQAIHNCPSGLEYLAAAEQLLVHQEVELPELLFGFESANKYEIRNTLGQKLYRAVEDTSCYNRMCCWKCRSFDIKILDLYQNEVLHFQRDLRCQSCCFPCCLQKLEVSAPPGTVIGTVEQQWRLRSPEFDIKNQHGDTLLTVRCPGCKCIPCRDINFIVLSTDGVEVGMVSKQWSGLVQEFFTDADNFGINFPTDVDVRLKATMLGALFLIDYMYFEKKQQLYGFCSLC